MDDLSHAQTIVYEDAWLLGGVRTPFADYNGTLLPRHIGLYPGVPIGRARTLERAATASPRLAPAAARALPS